ASIWGGVNRVPVLVQMRSVASTRGARAMVKRAQAQILARPAGLQSRVLMGQLELNDYSITSVDDLSAGVSQAHDKLISRGICWCPDDSSIRQKLQTRRQRWRTRGQRPGIGCLATYCGESRRRHIVRHVPETFWEGGGINLEHQLIFQRCE